MPPWCFFKLRLCCYASPTDTEVILCKKVSITLVFRKRRKILQVLMHLCLHPTVCQDKSGTKCQVLWAERIVEESSHCQQNSMDGSFWTVYGWSKSTNLSQKGKADPPAAPNGVEHSCTEAGNTGIEHPLIRPRPPRSCLAQTTSPGAWHWFWLG